MASETATPDLLTALLEHIRVLLGADHALYSEWDADAGTVTNLAWTGTLDAAEVSTAGLTHPIAKYLDDVATLHAFPTLEPEVCDAADPDCDEKTRAYLERIGAAREVYVHLPCDEGGYHELEVLYRDRERAVDAAALASLVDLGRLATVVIDHNRTADELRSSELRYRTLAEQLPAIVYVTNPSGRSSIPNPDGIRHLLGYPPEDWAADPKRFWERTIHPDDFPRVMSWVTDNSPEPPYSIEYRMRHADGRVLWVRDTALPVLGDDGQPERWQGLIVDVTSLISTRDALERSETRYRTLAQQLPAIVYDIGVDDVMTMHNTPALNGLGYSAERWADGAYELWRQSLYPEDRDRLEAAWHASRDSRSPWSSQYRFIGGDGRTVWVRDTAVPIELGQGEGTVWLGIVFDITDLVENAQRLQASEMRYRVLAEQVPALTYFRNVEGISTLVSPEQAVTLTGHSVEQWEADAHETWKAALHPDDRDEVVAGYHEAIAARRPHNESYRMITVDGRVIWARDIETELLDDDGRLLGWHGVTIDVTELEASGEALRVAEARYRNLVEQVPLVTYLDSADGVGIYVSPQVEEILEVSVDTWVGSYAAWLERVHPDDRDRADREYRDMLDGGDNFDLEYRVIRRDGSVRWMHDQGRRMSEPAGIAGLIQGVIYDVTDRHRAEAAAERRAGQQRVLAELGVRALGGIDRHSLVTQATEAAAATLNAWSAAVLELSIDGREVEIVAATGPLEVGLGARRPAGSSTAAGYALMTDGPLVSGDLETETRFAVLDEARQVGIRSLVCVKIAGSPAPYGVLAMYSQEPRAFTEDEVDFLQATANILATAVERDRAQAALAASEAQRQRVLGELLRSADAERARIATELHDDTIQVMTAALFALDRQINAHRRGDESAAEEAAATLRTTLAEAVERTRRLTFELRPPLLQQRGLVAAVAELLEETQRTTPIRTRLEASVSRHSGDVESLCYRTVQELVGNARKHSRAASLRVALTDRNGSVVARWRTTASASTSAARSTAASPACTWAWTAPPSVSGWPAAASRSGPTRGSGRPSGSRCRRGLRADGRRPAQLDGQREVDVLVHQLVRLDALDAEAPEVRDDPLDQPLRCGGAGCDADRLDALQPARIDVGLVVDQVGGDAHLAGDVDQPVRVRGVARADHEHQVDLACELLDRVLPVLRGVADVVLLRPDDRRVALPQRRDDLDRLVHGQRRLRDEGDPLGILDLQAVDLGDGSDQLDRVGRLAHRADDFLVTLVADQDDRVAVGGEPHGLRVHLRDQRAGGVDHAKAALRAVAVHVGRDAVRGEHDDAAAGHVELAVDEHGAAVGQVAHDVAVVHDLLAHVDRRAEVVERALDRIDRPVDAGAVAAG